MTDTANAPERIWAFHAGPMVGLFIGKKEVGTNVSEYVLATHCDELVAAAYMDAAQVLEDEIDLARIALPQAVPVLRSDIKAIKNRTPTKAMSALTAYGERMKAEGAREAQAKIARLTEALEFYADDNRTGLPSDGPWGLGSNDFGSRARAALQENVDE